MQTMRKVTYEHERNVATMVVSGVLAFSVLAAPTVSDASPLLATNQSTHIGTNASTNVSQPKPQISAMPDSIAVPAPPATANGQPARIGGGMVSSGIWPARGVVTDEFGAAQAFRILSGLGRHTGTDIANVIGTTIVAYKSGIVIKSSNVINDACGRFVEIDHGTNIVSLYCHMSNATAKVGTIVQMGDKIGEMGSTGASTGSHVHFQINVNGSAVNTRTIVAGNPTP